MEKKLRTFLDSVEDSAPVYARSLEQSLTVDIEHRDELASAIISWAESLLGGDAIRRLASGYVAFVQDVATSQARYEMTGIFSQDSFASVAERTYLNREFMADYHWGVLATTFAWDHHARIAEFFASDYLQRLDLGGTVIDLGGGSSVWSLLLLRRLDSWRATVMDISPYSVEQAGALAAAAGFGERHETILGDVTLGVPAGANFDAGICAFVLEHVSEPREILAGMYDVLKSDSLCFFTTAIQAAESDHIYEFSSETEVTQLIETSGFRIVAVLSLPPQEFPLKRKYLPRSIAVVCQKK